ncbi:MAG: transglutaminase family protein [Caulobacteraceae bacterium]|nr:transglutaminase family protein [Caulobacteraceae bacterium]
MTRLTIRHETVYDYDQPVAFSPHRLMLRPRDSHASRLVNASLELSPPGETRWVYDAMGNCVCWFSPQGEARQLRITSHLTIDRYPAPLAPVQPHDPHTNMPIVYELNDRLVLSPFMTPASEDADGAVLAWLRGHMGPPDEPVLDFLTRLNSAIHGQFGYVNRYVEGVQAPTETLALGSGACRDLAWLMVEAVRQLGFAAQFVTGYLYSPGGGSAVRGAGATHAWCQVFLPQLGWLEFDPTNGLVESPDLIQVGATRSPTEAAPVAGNLIGFPGNSRLSVSVEVYVDEQNPAAA